MKYILLGRKEPEQASADVRILMYGQIGPWYGGLFTSRAGLGVKGLDETNRDRQGSPVALDQDRRVPVIERRGGDGAAA